MLWSATSINKYRMDSSGRTAYYRVTGGSHRRPIAKFGERVWWLPNGPRDPGMKAESRTREGIYLGVRKQTAESLIGTDDGIMCARTVTRMPSEQRWSKEKVLGVALSVAGNCNMGIDPGDSCIPSGGGDSSGGVRDDVGSNDVQFDHGADSVGQRNADAASSEPKIAASHELQPDSHYTAEESNVPNVSDHDVNQDVRVLQWKDKRKKGKPFKTPLHPAVK